MDLYHFTAIPMLHSILASEGLREGYLTLYDGTILYNKVWLTTSPLPYGHGLCNGTEKLSESEKSFIRRAGNMLDSAPINRTHNKKLIRLKIDSEWIKKQPGFCSYKKLMRALGQPKAYIKYVGAMGIEGARCMTNEQINKIMRKGNTKEDTWYIFNGVIPPSRIVSVEYMETKDKYVPYDFESHGRDYIENSGIYPISSLLLSNLNNAMQNITFLPGSVIAFCHKENSEENILFRHVLFTCSISLRSFSVLIATGDETSFYTHLDILKSWVQKNAKELCQLFEKARKSYHK
ncbi:TPA: hypothetical protein ACJFRO_004286, partial [Escherichia coli]